MIKSFNGIAPQIAEDCFIAENSTITGAVEIGQGSSVWFGAVIRGDEAKISIGSDSNIQDNAVLHCNSDFPLVIGDLVTVGHGAIVHGATVGNRVLIGMGAIVLDRAVLEDDCVVGAGAVVTSGTVTPAGGVAVGIPAKVIKTDVQANRVDNTANAMGYSQLAEEYKQ